MATKEHRGSGFDYPLRGTTAPKGSTIKQNKDGTVSVIPPKKSNSSKPKK